MLHFDEECFTGYNRPWLWYAVAQAQHALREMVDTFKKNDIKVSYAIHPVAGRMSGHMKWLIG